MNMRRSIAFLLAFLACAPASAERPEPQNAVAEVGPVLVARGWRTAYRQHDPVVGYGLSGGAFLRPWFELAGSVDHTRRTSTPTDLRIRNTETWILAGPRFSWWVDFVRFFGEASAGGVLRTASYDSDAVSGTTRGTFGFGVGGGFSIVIASRVALSIRSQWRRRDDQAHLAMNLDATWLFHSKTQTEK